MLLNGNWKRLNTIFVIKLMLLKYACLQNGVK